MSTSEPFLPIEEPTSPSPAAQFERVERDEDPDILPGRGEDEVQDGVEDEVEPDFPSNPRLRTPEPGARLTAGQLESDLDGQ